MNGMDRPKKRKRTFLLKMFWIGLISISLAFLSVKVIMNEKASKFYVGIDKLFEKGKK